MGQISCLLQVWTFLWPEWIAVLTFIFMIFSTWDFCPGSRAGCGQAHQEFTQTSLINALLTKFSVSLKLSSFILLTEKSHLSAFGYVSGFCSVLARQLCLAHQIWHFWREILSPGKFPLCPQFLLLSNYPRKILLFYLSNGSLESKSNFDLHSSVSARRAGLHQKIQYKKMWDRKSVV